MILKQIIFILVLLFVFYLYYKKVFIYINTRNKYFDESDKKSSKKL
jgi:F0F1-type ATP synthase membrane subunit b/b'